MPINAELAYRQVDSLRIRQEQMALQVDEIYRRLEDEREERLRVRAETLETLKEIEEALRMLSNRVEESIQFYGVTQQSGGQGIPQISPPIDTLQKSSGDSSLADTLEATPDLTGGGESERLFRSSYMDLTLGNYDLAVQGFKNYLVRYPAGGRLPEVHYYLGESYYASERYLEAVGEFQYVVREFPSSRLVPAAFLKSGICYAGLDELSLAERTFRELISRYPDTEEAEQARIALKDLGG